MAQGAATGGTAFNVRIRILLVATAAAMVAACGGGGGSPNETLAEPAAAAVTPVAAAATPPAASAAPPAAAAPAQASGLVASPADLANTSLPGNQYVRSAAALADGGYAVAWLDGTQLAAQRFDASGAKAGTETHVGASFAPDAAVTVLRDGSIVTASADAQGVSLQHFNAQGSPTSAAAVAATGASQPMLLALDDGGVALGWAQVHDGNLRSQHVQRFDAQLRAGGSPVDFAPASEDRNVSLSLVAAPGGSFVAGVTHRYQGISYVQYRIGGRDVGAFDDANTGLPEFNTTLAPLADGRFALWSIGSGGGYLQLLDAGGNAVGAPTPLTAAPETGVALAGGGWVTVTRQMFGQPTIAQRFDASGATAGAPVEAAPGMSRPLFTAHLASGFAMAWTFTGTLGDSDVRTQRIGAP